MLLNFSAYGERFQSFNDIAEQLNPLEFVANHGGVRRSVNLNILFETNSTKLLSEANNQLDALGKAMTSDRLRGFRFQLIGHTDAVGPAAYNLRLSVQRADAVANYLLDHFDIEKSRIETIGKGETDLLAKQPPNSKVHRRVEIVAISLTNDGAEDSPNNGGDSTQDIKSHSSSDGGNRKGIRW